jgi:hypothetical protein
LFFIRSAEASEVPPLSSPLSGKKKYVFKKQSVAYSAFYLALFFFPIPHTYLFIKRAMTAPLFHFSKNISPSSIRVLSLGDFGSAFSP